MKISLLFAKVKALCWEIKKITKLWQQNIIQESYFRNTELSCRSQSGISTKLSFKFRECEKLKVL